MKARVLLLLLFSLVAAARAQADEQNKIVIDSDTQLAPDVQIKGVTDGSQGSYSTTLRLKAAKPFASVKIVPSGIRTTDKDGKEISATATTQATLSSLSDKAPNLLTVTVSGAMAPGRYSGKLDLSGPSDEPLGSIPLTLNLTPKPDIGTLPTRFAFRISRCMSPITCWFAERLNNEPPGELREWSLQNPTGADVDWISNSLALYGARTTSTLEDADVPVVSPTKCGPTQQPAVAYPVPLFDPKTRSARTAKQAFCLDRSKLKADHYEGTYRIGLRGAPEIKVPFTLDVHDGPLFPLLVLLLGICFGRLLKAANSQQLQDQVSLLDQYNRVSGQVNAITQANIAQALRQRLNEIHIDILNSAQSRDILAGQMAAVVTLVSDNQKLDIAEAAINNLTNAALQNALNPLLANARNSIAVLNAQAAEQTLATIDTALASGQPPAAAPPAMLVAAPPAAPPVAPVTPQHNWVVRTISFLSGADPIGAGWFLVWGRPLLFLSLLILLVSIGLNNSYLSDPKFGSEGYFDYLGLLMWGIGSDVTQQAVQRLTLTRPS